MYSRLACDWGFAKILENWMTKENIAAAKNPTWIRFCKYA